MKTLNPVEAGAIPLDDAPDSAEWFDPGKLGLIPVEGPIAATTDYIKLYARGATSQGIYMGAAGAARGISKTIEPELNPYMAMTPDAISERQTDLQARIKEYSEMQESARAEFARMGVKSERTIDPRMQEMERELSLLEEASAGQRTAVNQAREAISKPFELYAQEAQAIRDAIVKGLPVDPEREASFAGGLAQGFGQITTMLPSYFIPGFGPMLAVGQVYQAGYDDYVQTMEAQGREFDPDEAHKVGMRNMPAGALNVLSDKLVISKILKPLKGKMTVGELQKTLAVTAAVGAATEGSQEFWQNFVAKHLAGYDPDRKLDDGVIDAMIIGAIVDATVATGGQALTSKLAQAEPQKSADWTPEQSGAIPLDEVTPTPAEPATPAEQQPASEQRTQESQPPVVRESESLQEVTPDAEVETSQNREVETALEAGEQGAAEGVDVESGRSDEAAAPEAVEQTAVVESAQGSEVAPAAETLTPERREQLEETRSMLHDMMQMKRANSENIPDQWRKRLAEVDSELNGEEKTVGLIASEPVFGHPEATTLGGNKFNNLIPIKIDSRERLDGYISRAQAQLDEVQKKLSTAEAIDRGHIKKNKKETKQAKDYLKSQNRIEDETIRDLLRNETMPELNRLWNALPETTTQVDESTPARVEGEGTSTAPQPVDTTEATQQGEGRGGEVTLTAADVRKQQAAIDGIVRDAVNAGIPEVDAMQEANRLVDDARKKGSQINFALIKRNVMALKGRKAEARFGKESLDAPVSPSGDMTLADTQESGEATPAQAAEASDRAQMVQAAIQKLPERQRLLVQRIFFEGKKPADVARELGLSKTTIGKDYKSASTALKEALISLSNDATPQTADRRLALVPESFHRTQAVLRWFREWATTWKNVPRELVPSLESAEASERAHYERGRMIIRDLKREQRKAYGRKDLDRAETELRDALLNPDAMDVLPPKVKQEAMRLRNLMDELSLRVVNEVITDPDFALTILDNTGSYMRRSYRVFSDPEWHKKVDPITLQQGKAWIRDNWDKKRTLTDEETDIVAAELLDPSKAGGFMLGGSKVGGKDVTSLIKRKEIAPEIRALMGEITNPFDSAAETVKRQASLIENHHAQRAMRRVGLESGLFTDRKTPTHFKELAGVKNPGPYDVMAGLYTTPETFDALTGHYKGSGKLTFLGGVMEFFRSASGTAKMTKTILAPVTWPVNYIGAYMDLIPQGNFNPASYLRGVDHVLEKTGIWSRINGRTVVDRQKLQDQIVKMARYGLMDQNLTANDMIRAVNKSLVGRVPLVKDATRVSATIFQSGDNIVKFAAWEQEMARYKKAFPNMPEAELEARVAEIVAQTTQMYERTPVVLKDASTILPIQSFVNFLYDTNRKIVNTARLAKSEISEGNRTGNKELTKIGTTRAVAMTTTLVASSSLGVALMSRLFNGVDEDEEEAMRFFMPPWFEDNNIFWASGIDKGVATYANAGYLLPHANALQPFEAGWRKGEGVEGVFNETVNAFASQYLQEPVHLNPILDAARNTTQTGRRIVNEEDPNKTSKLLGYVAKKTWEPGIVRQIDRMWMAINNESGIYGQEFTVKSEIYRMVGLRAQDVDVRKQLPFKARDLNQRWQNATNLYKLSRNRNLSETEMERRYADSEAARQEVFNEFVKMRTYGNRVGLTDSEIIAAMRNTPGISRALVADVLRGQYRPAPKD